MRKDDADSPPPQYDEIAPPRTRFAHVFLWLIALLSLLIVLLIGALYFAAQTEAGTRLLWNNLSRLIPGQISGRLVEGTLGSGLVLQDVRYVNGKTMVRIDRLRGRWRLTLNPLTLTVHYLRIGTVDAQLAPSPKEDKPPTLPAQLTLPLALDLRELLVNKVVLHGENGETVYGDIRLQAKSDSVNHTVQLAEADTPFGHVSARFMLNGKAPFDIKGTASLSGSRLERQYSAKAELSGTLSALSVKADAASGDFSGKADVLATPFERVPVRRADIHLKDFNPNAFNTGWPKAELSLDASLAPAGNQAPGSPPAVSGPVSVVNILPGAWNEGLLPFASANTEVLLTRSTRRLSQLTIGLAGDGTLSGSGALDEEGHGQLELTAEDLNLHALHTALKPTQLDGPVSLKLGESAQTVEVKLTDSDIAMQARAEFTPEQILLHEARLSSGEAQLALSGKLARGSASGFSVEGKLAQFDPVLFLAEQDAPAKRAARKRGGKPASRGKSGTAFHADINMDFQAQGSLQPEFSAALTFDIRDSRYAGQPMTGGGHIQLAGKHVLSSNAQLLIAGNRAAISGSFGEPSDRLNVEINAPALGRLGFGLSGSLTLSGQVQGTPDSPQLAATYRAKDLEIGDVAVASLRGNAKLGGLPASAPAAQTVLRLTARNARRDDIRFSRVDVDIAGTYRDHSIRLNARGTVGSLRTDLGVTALGRLSDTGKGLAWSGTVNRLNNAGTPQLSLAAPVSIAYAPGKLKVGTARLMLAKALVQLQYLRYDGASIQTKGSLRQLDTAHLLSIYREFAASTPPVDSTLVLNGDWDLGLGRTPRGTLHIERSSGDLSVVRNTRKIALGLNRLALQANLNGERIAMNADINAARIGSIAAQGNIGLDPASQWGLPDQASSVSARIEAKIPSLQSLTVLVGPAVTVEGTAAAEIAITGTLGDPVLAGTVNGDKLGLSVYDQGIRLRDGIARLRIENDVVDIQKFELRGGGGFLRATGRVPLDQTSQDLKANITADKLQILASPAGRMTISGQATASSVDQQLFIGGKFTVDHALFSLPEKRAPELSDDVVIIRDSKSGKQAPAPGTDAENKPASPFSPHVSIEVDLGKRFRFKGAGAELRLAGSIRIESAPGETLQAFGTVRVVEGTYEAFGAELNIERGILNFQGPLNNPNVNILAMRREQDVSVGVQITGTVKQPRVLLVADPNVSDEEKLSWLVFGRAGGSTDPGQAQSAAQGAALGLLNKLGGARIGKKLGLDEFSIDQSEFGLQGTQVVNLGKEITDRLSIGFEQSLASAASVMKITYELTRHWSVVLRGGDVIGIDMAYNKRFDHLFRLPHKQVSPDGESAEK